MRPALATILVLLMLTAPVTQAVHEGRPVPPAEKVAKVMRDVIFQVNDTIAAIEEEVGPSDPLLQQARGKLKQAGEAHNVGHHFQTVSLLWESVTLAHRAQIEHETADARDPNAAFYARTETKWREARGWTTQVHERLLDLQEVGVDLWVLDHAILAGMLVAQGERNHHAWSAVAEGWSKGQRSDQAKNGLVGFAYGPILYADIADQLLTLALREQPDQPVGPTVGNATLRGIVEEIEPLVANRSVSFDQQLSGLVAGNMAEKEWLAALGAIVVWAHQQAPAAVQHRLDKPDRQFDAANVTERLGHLLAESAALDQLDALGVPGATVRYHVPEAIATYHESQRELDEGNETQLTVLRSATGLGAMSSLDMSLAMVLLAAGESPPKEVIHLPAGEDRALEIDDPPTTPATTGQDETEADGGVPWWAWLAGLTVLAAVAVAIARRSE